MPLRLMSALCILLLAGCTSSEPQNASYAPLTDGSVTMPGSPSPPALADQTGQIPSGETIAGAPQQAGLRCKTVDDVTLCDAPADPSADDTSYTN